MLIPSLGTCTTFSPRGPDHRLVELHFFPPDAYTLPGDLHHFSPRPPDHRLTDLVGLDFFHPMLIPSLGTCTNFPPELLIIA